MASNTGVLVDVFSSRTLLDLKHGHVLLQLSLLSNMAMNTDVLASGGGNWKHSVVTPSTGTLVGVFSSGTFLELKHGHFLL